MYLHLNNLRIIVICAYGLVMRKKSKRPMPQLTYNLKADTKESTWLERHGGRPGGWMKNVSVGRP